MHVCANVRDFPAKPLCIAKDQHGTADKYLLGAADPGRRLCLPEWGILRVEELALVLAELAVVGIGLPLNLVDYLVANKVLHDNATVTSNNIGDLLSWP